MLSAATAYDVDSFVLEDNSSLLLATELQQPAASRAIPAAPPPPPRPPSSYRQSNIRLASVPNMFGDTTDGGCGGLFISGTLAATVGHPTYGCSRLNIAENNSPIVRNRVYYAYRHFESATDVDIFSYSPQGREGHLDIDRHLLGFESKIASNTSIEMRIPINTELNSSLEILATDSGTTTDGSNNNLDALLNNRATSLGNIDVILKTRVMERDDFYLSCGVGVNIPTAPNVRVRGNINDPNFQIYDSRKTLEENIQSGPVNGPVPTGDSLLFEFDGIFQNETVTLLPFLAFVWTPTDEWFVQGFGQIDVALNESTGSLGLKAAVLGFTLFDTLDNPDTAQLALQTLLRLNLGVGRWLYQNEEGYINALGVLVEFHYSTTLNDSDIARLQLLRANQFPFPFDQGLAAGFGNLANRVDILNCVIGVPIHIGQTAIYNGFTAPIREERGFNFEYLFAINRRF